MHRVGRHAGRWGEYANAFLIPHGDIYAPGAVHAELSLWKFMRTVGPLGGVDGTRACATCGAWKFPGESCTTGSCCMPHPQQPGPAFVPPEVRPPAWRTAPCAPLRR